MKKPIHTSGKRKTAIAKATVREGSGKVRINKSPVEIFEPEMVRMKLMEPLLLVPKVAAKVDIDVTVKGGGFMGQAEAARTAIGRGLVDFTGDVEVKDTLASYDRTLVISDHRRKETKKYGGPGARAKKQKSYR